MQILGEVWSSCIGMEWLKLLVYAILKHIHLEALKKTAEIMPMVDQVELHPGFNQNELLELL